MTGFDGATEVETGCFTDNQLGVAQDIEIYQSGFVSGTIIEDTTDIVDICFEMEHSFIGDIVVILTCPNGQSITFHQQGGGGLNLGEPNPATNMDEFPCNDPATVGVPYQYCFAPGQNQTWVEYANTGGGAGTLPAGSYQPVQPFSNLVGCPANGIWTLTVVDNWAVDDGQIYSFALNLNPEFYPPVTIFTPDIGIDASQSFWNTASLPSYATINDSNADEISIVPTQAGTDVFTYTVVDDFGCSNSTSFTVTTFEALQVTAGADFELGCGSTQLQGGFIGMPSCTDCMNNYNIPYQPSTFLTETYCPDASDGTMMAITVSGSVETCCDLFQIYNGTDVNAPVLFSWGQGIGLPATLNPPQQFVSTDPSGCITFSINPDGSVQPVITITVTAFTPDGLEIGGGPIYDFLWTPSTGLSDNTTLNPEVLNIDETTTFTLVGFPSGHPGCASTDEVMVSIMPGMNPGLDSTTTICANASNVLLTDLLAGNPVSTGVWTDPNGNDVPNGTLTGSNNLFGNYTYTVSWGNGCFLDANLLVTAPESPLITLTTTDSIMCPNELIVLNNNVSGGAPNYNYSWTFNNIQVSTGQNLNDFIPIADGDLCLKITDACGMTATKCINVTYNETFPISAIASSTCWPQNITLENTTPAANYTDASWSINGVNVPNSGTILEYTPANAGTIDLTLTLTNSNGCIYDSTLTGIANSFAPPVPNIAYTQNNLLYSFYTDLSYMTYDWSAIGTDTSMFGLLPTFDVDFPQGENIPYGVNLSVTDNNGCAGFATTDIVVTGYNASGIGCPEGIENCGYGFIPNIVSPNGDGKNDFFWVPNKNLKSLEVTIFNRWGSKVGSITTPNKIEMLPTQIWNAQDYNAGIYYYTIIAEGKDGIKHEANGQFLLDK
jgi:gliding motility-associated-like protein